MVKAHQKGRKGLSTIFPQGPDDSSKQPAKAGLTLTPDGLPSTNFIDIIEFLPDPTFVIDRQGLVVAWNRAIEEMTGVPKSEILGKGGYAYSIPFYDLARPIVIDYALGVGQGIEPLYSYLLREGDTVFAETFSPNLNAGKGAFLWGKASPLYDPDGNIVGAVESIRDITTHKEAVESLRKSEEKYRELVENANSIILRLDTLGNITFFNEFAESFFGFTQEEILGRNIVGLIVPSTDSYGRNMSAFVRELCTNPDKFATNENENVRRDGKRIWVAWTNKAMRDADGKVREVLCIGNDITQRKQMEKALSESEEKYRLIFQNSPLGIFHFDSDGIVTACNEKIVEIWGSTKERFIGLNLLSSLKNKKMKAAVMACLSGRYACYEGSYLSITGGRLTDLKADFGPIFALDDSVKGGIGLIEDISERKKAEEALLESENRLRLLSAKLLSAQEKERKRIAGELHDSIGSLLSSIKIGLENTVNVAKNSGFRPEMLQSLIGLTRHAMEESRRITADLRPSMLDDLGVLTTLGWLTRNFQSVYPAVSVKINLLVEENDIPDHLKIVIFRVVQEALHNVAKHSGATRVILKLEKRDNLIRMRIEDNGLGFDSSLLSGKEEKGLGLVSMSERVGYSGGSIVIESKEGHGTCISASWPLEPPPSGAEGASG